MRRSVSAPIKPNGAVLEAGCDAPIGTTVTSVFAPRAALPPLKSRITVVQAAVRFALIYADPGWEYAQGGRGAINDRYTQSGPEAIHNLDVPSITADNAVLFLWGTWPQLPIVMATFPAWGFEYKTCGFVWVKHHKHKPCKACKGVGWRSLASLELEAARAKLGRNVPSVTLPCDHEEVGVWCKACGGTGAIEGKRRIGGGFWTRANTEFCLIGVRGKDHPKRVTKAIRQLIETDEEEKQLIAPNPTDERGKVIHSAKPPEARERIVQLMGDELPRIELFARERVGGWAAWGDDKKIGKPDVDLRIRGAE